MDPIKDRMVEVKERVEELKGKVVALQSSLGDKNMVDDRGRRLSAGEWNRQRQLLKVQLANATEELREAKSELRKLSGTTGSNPLWEVVRKAYRVLLRLEEAGVEIGEDGREAMETIEFHVPFSKLEESDGNGS